MTQDKVTLAMGAGGKQTDTTDTSTESKAKQYAMSIKNDKSGIKVYMTSGGKAYHLDKNCQGMTKAKQITRAEAMVMGKTKCDVCMKGSSGGDAASAGGDGDGNTVSLTTASGEVKVYATKNGT